MDRDCSELCVRCGLCCVVLSAEVTLEAVEKLSNWSGKLPTEIAMLEHRQFQGKGNLVLKRPCVFLLGKPMQYVSCRAYGTERPAVCGAYLCKIAIRYKAGACSLQEALFILNASVSRHGGISMFNWSADPSYEGDKNDGDLIVAMAKEKFNKKLRERNPEFFRKIDEFKNAHPHYYFRHGSVNETVFAAIIKCYQDKVMGLDQFFDESEIKGWSERDKKIALLTVYQVIEDIYGLMSEVPQKK